MTHWLVPSAFVVQVVASNALVSLSFRKSGVSSARMTAVPTHGSMSSFFEALYATIAGRK